MAIRGQSTEWEDVQRKFGNLPEKEVEITAEQFEAMLVEAAEKKQDEVMQKKTLDELEELEDEEDEAFLEKYRQQRIEQMKEAAKNDRYGTVEEISRTDFKQEVSDAGDMWVVCHLYQDGIPECQLVNRCMMQLADKLRGTKFVKIISTRCIPNYPDKNLPTILIYHKGDVRGQIIGIGQIGGLKMTPDDLEWELSKTGAFKTDIDEPPHKKSTFSMKRGAAARAQRGEDDSDEDSDF
uniref:Phosducin domain-containing protein n=1 Tax=Palpitomonas bilix TaxID=652834 RepID=A0A7S3DET0_9EUKA|mmetsp:Transcript_34129/g.88086  ORF Transcript_34129/g.88086 Transcript_34129/m.88086 type:complete len:238 (+) Transcript_34129:196-909(+)|eukprot:CAMPEP_0113885054 /NCGR_PEP_ID=MMETSP0780_2-20120614/10669_1 /TAXON_ID=652834 /ORGANISM="Palpitomonas bilix" /LENGTH=237 /DNA_ID=CAMNT_0000872881 /DNA_START=120 /DNA_END=833 /DNA_ORIENTATION=- /assembly_acc=CAM_ASM_000599